MLFEDLQNSVTNSEPSEAQPDSVEQVAQAKPADGADDSAVQEALAQAPARAMAALSEPQLVEEVEANPAQAVAPFNAVAAVIGYGMELPDAGDLLESVLVESVPPTAVGASQSAANSVPTPTPVVATPALSTAVARAPAPVSAAGQVSVATAAAHAAAPAAQVAAPAATVTLAAATPAIVAISAPAAGWTVPLGPPDPFELALIAADPDDAPPKVLLDKAEATEKGADKLRKKAKGLSRKATSQRIVAYRKIRDGKAGFPPRPTSGIADWEMAVLSQISGGLSTLRHGIDMVNLLDEVRAQNGRIDPLVLGIPWRNMRDELNAMLGRKKPPTQEKLREWAHRSLEQYLMYDPDPQATKAMPLGEFHDSLIDDPLQLSVTPNKTAANASNRPPAPPTLDPFTAAMLALVVAEIEGDPLVPVDPLVTDIRARARGRQVIMAVRAVLEDPPAPGAPKGDDDEDDQQSTNRPPADPDRDRKPPKHGHRRKRSSWGVRPTPGQPSWTKGDKLRSVEEMLALPPVEDAGPCKSSRNRRHKMEILGSRSKDFGVGVYVYGCRCGGRWHCLLGSIFDDESLGDPGCDDNGAVVDDEVVIDDGDGNDKDKAV